jgi:hypothetical protein
MAQSGRLAVVDFVWILVKNDRAAVMGTSVALAPSP